MSALLCCGSCFDAHNLGEDGIIYSWLDSLLTSSDDKVTRFEIADVALGLVTDMASATFI